MTNHEKIVVLSGGPGVERDISLMTAQNVEKALTELSLKFISLSADWDNLQKLKSLQPEKVFLAVHGPYGEDGILQGYLESLKIPYTGSGVLASALCMDKIFFKKLMKAHGISTPSYQVFSGQRAVNHQPEKKPPFLPCVVKPNRSGSSLGTYICRDEREFQSAFKEAFKFDHNVIAEEYIEGAETAVSWLDGRVLTPVEIEPVQKEHFYDFKRKYEKNQTQYFVPPRLPKDTIEKLKQMTQTIQKICGIRSYCRGDFIVDKKGKIFILEMNTLPGLTSLSLLPKSAQHDGISYNDLILKILESARLDY